MSEKISLVVMAAGIGSRFGKGIKQLTPMGPKGEIIMDYSIYDALKAGVDRVVFIIRHDLENDFKEIIGNRIAKYCPVAYALQEKEDLPAPFTVPEGRTKPWGTGQAILSCKEIVDGPFIVINADDYYGKGVFENLVNFLKQTPAKSNGRFNFCMSGYKLKNTLSDNGGVSRGVCKVSKDGYLESITETHHIEKTAAGAGSVQDDGSVLPLPLDASVSMNMWGLTPDVFPVLEKKFVSFLQKTPADNLKAEFLLPTILDEMLKENEATIRVLPTDAAWFGVTYAADTPVVQEQFKKLCDEGVYPAGLFGKA
ncbi:MAG: nucleotidyltransferase [Clostridia bacterium]|nr:nucleotidyltransferase [Clostridia bacterium]